MTQALPVVARINAALSEVIAAGELEPTPGMPESWVLAGAVIDQQGRSVPVVVVSPETPIHAALGLLGLAEGAVLAAAGGCHFYQD